jgi:type IV secretory pathway VirB4 component
MPIYQEYLPKLRWRAAHLSDKVPWRCLAAPGVMLHKQTNALQRTYAVRGPDLSSEVQEVQGALMLQANNVFKRLGGSWTMHAEAQRVPVTTYPESLWPHPVAALIDAERKRAILEDPGSFETFYFLTLTWQPPGSTASLADRLFIRRPQRPVLQTPISEAPMRTLEEFVTQADYLLYLLRGMLAMGRPLTTNELLTYLHSTVSAKRHPVYCPAFPVDLDVMLCDSNFLGGWEPQLGIHLDQPPDLVVPGRQHLRVCSVTSFPPQSMAGVLKALNSRQFPYRYCTRWVAFERQVQEGLLEKAQSHWLGQQKTLWTQFVEVLSKQPSEMVDNSARNQALDADAARQEVGADIVAFGDFTATITVCDEDLQKVEAKLSDVMQILDSQGFTSIREQEHATAAWLSSHPGNRVDSVRRTPQHSLTLSHLMPGLQAAWPGVDHDAHLKQGPWFLAHTEGQTKFSVVNHVLDNGHFKVLGPTRTGKSVLANLMVASWPKYHGAQAAWWDLDGSARCLTLCLGGAYHHIGADGVGFQPYAGIDDDVERGWAFEWTLRLLQSEKVPITEVVQRYVSGALRELAKRPVRGRTITGLLEVMTARPAELELMRPKQTDLRNAMDLERSGVRRALEEYTSSGTHGGLLDASDDGLGEGWLHTFEQKTLLTMPRLVGPVTNLLFHRMEQRFETRRPMLVVMDDAAVTWALPDYQENGKKWMVTTAKKNVSLGFFTHSLTQVFDSPLGGLLIESCPTTFVLPNSAARKPALAAVYERMGFNAAEIAMIASLRPQRDCYYTNELLGKRPFSLYLSPLLLSIMARNTAEDHDAMDLILAQEGPQGFAPAWLRAQGFPDAATSLAEELSHAFPLESLGGAAAEPVESVGLSTVSRD